MLQKILNYCIESAYCFRQNKDKISNHAVFVVTIFSPFRTLLILLCSSTEFSLSIANILLENYRKVFFLLKIEGQNTNFLRKFHSFCQFSLKKTWRKENTKTILDICLDDMIHLFIHHLIQKVWFFQVFFKKIYSIFRRRKNDEISKLSYRAKINLPELNLHLISHQNHPTLLELLFLRFSL